MSEEQARRAARREAAKRLHPDRGGDAAEFDRAMRSFEPGGGTGPARSSTPTGADRDGADPDDVAAAATSSAGPVHVRRTRRGAWATTLRSTTTLVADVLRRLPRSFPGSRRYGRL